MTRMVPQWLGALAVLALCGCAGQPLAVQAPSEPAAAGSVRFACGNGETVEMQFYPEQGRSVMRRSGWTVELPRQAAASGYAYSNGPTTVLGKGNEMTLQIGHLAPIWCRSSRPLLVAGAAR